MKAVLALIVIYVGTFLVAIQGASNAPVEASEQSRKAESIDPAKEADIRSLLEMVGAKQAIADTAGLATEPYREKVIRATANDQRAQTSVNHYLADFQRKFDADAVNQQLVGIYDKHFSDEEIKGLLEFYGSPLGQKVAAEWPEINREVQFAARSAGTQAARQAWQDLRADDPNAGESPAHRRVNAGARPRASSAIPTISADSSQP